MVDLAEIEKLIESAFEQLPVHLEYIDPGSYLDDLHGKVAFMVKGLVADN